MTSSTGRTRPRSAPPILFTCEHGGHEVPADLRPLFRGHRETLLSHRGWDIGALGVARVLADELKTPLLFETTSRLVIELNRSLDHPRLFSEFTRTLDAAGKKRLIDEIYLPYRSSVESALRGIIRKRGVAIHIGVHSFTPVLNGRVRDYEVGLLFDPKRAIEKAFCERWRRAMRAARPGLTLRFNLPYRGWTDGFTTYLRARFADDHFAATDLAQDAAAYAGIELEVRNDLVHAAGAQREFARFLASTLREAASPFTNRTRG